MVLLKNDEIFIKINENGAEIVEGKYLNGEDFIWQGSEIWPDHSPVLFPICGRLIDNKCTHNGKEYSMGLHGFAQDFDFEVLEKTDTTALFCLTYNKETLKQYPFKFKFFVRYTLDGKKVIVENKVENADECDIYFSLGSHEGYYIPDGVENYHLLLDDNKTLNSACLDGPYLNGKSEVVIENARKIPLKSDTYTPYDLIFLDIDFTAITLYHNSGKKIVKAEFEGYPNLLVWSLPESQFVCIEPWYGIPDYTSDVNDREFVNKKGLIKLGVGKDFLISNSFILP